MTENADVSVLPNAEVDSLFAEYDRADSPGCTVAVHRDGELIYARGYGMADLETGAVMDPMGSQVYTCSVSKQFTAACVILLAQRGAVGLDDDIRRHFPELPDLGATITLRHLLHHTSGLREELELWEMSGRRFDETFGNADMLELLCRQRELNFAPGSRYAYCNSGYMLLAELVKRISDLTLRDFADRELFGPLGMHHTHYDDDNAATPSRVVSYRIDGDGRFIPFAKNFTIVGSGGLLATAADLCRWAVNFHDPKIGGPDFVREMRRTTPLTDGTESAYAAGLWDGSYMGMPALNHDGGMLGFRTSFLCFHKANCAVVVLGNLDTLTANNLGYRVAQLLLADLFRLEPFAGDYRSEELGRTCSVSTTVKVMAMEAPDGGELLPDPAGRDLFNWGRRNVAFRRDDNGTVSGFRLSSKKVDGVWFERVSQSPRLFLAVHPGPSGCVPPCRPAPHRPCLTTTEN